MKSYDDGPTASEILARYPWMREPLRAEMTKEYRSCIENPASCFGTNTGLHSHTCSNGHTWAHVGWENQLQELDDPGSYDARHLCPTCGEDVRLPDLRHETMAYLARRAA